MSLLPLGFVIIDFAMRLVSGSKSLEKEIPKYPKKTINKNSCLFIIYYLFVTGTIRGAVLKCKI